MKKILYGLTLFIIAGIAALSGAIIGGIAMYQAGVNDQFSESNSVDNKPTITTIETTIEQLPEEFSEAQTTETIVENLPVLTSDELYIDIETPITDAVEKVGPAVVTVVDLDLSDPRFLGFFSALVWHVLLPPQKIEFFEAPSALLLALHGTFGPCARQDLSGRPTLAGSMVYLMFSSDRYESTFIQNKANYRSNVSSHFRAFCSAFSAARFSSSCSMRLAPSIIASPYFSFSME